MAWWRQQMETFSALLAICAGNSPVPGEFPTQRPVTRSFDDYFDLRPNKRLSKQSWGWWFETPSRPLWRHRNGRTEFSEIWVWVRYPVYCTPRQIRNMSSQVMVNIPYCWYHSSMTVSRWGFAELQAKKWYICYFNHTHYKLASPTTAVNHATRSHNQCNLESDSLITIFSPRICEIVANEIQCDNTWIIRYGMYIIIYALTLTLSQE